jgi:hypothetical protein
MGSPRESSWASGQRRTSPLIGHEESVTSRHSHLWRRVFPMSSPTSTVLQQLNRLDISSPGFRDQLDDFLYGEEYKECVRNPQNGDLVWLVEYLDKVHLRVALPRSPLKLAQALDSLDPSCTTSRKCVRELSSICGAAGILPTSYTLSSDLNISRDPFTEGGYGDVYEGTLGGLKVCIKRVRVYTGDAPEKVIKVCH